MSKTFISIARAHSDDEESNTSWFRASTNELDRHGTIVEPRGIDTSNFSKNPVFMWGHDAYGGNAPPDMENVLGRVVDFKTTDSEFDIGVEWAGHDRAVMARNLVRAGFLSGVSVGFIPDPEGTSTRAVDGSEVPVYTKTELVEVSLVPIPSNPSAVAIMRSMQLPVISQDPSPSEEDADSEGLRDEIRSMLGMERIRTELKPKS
jgi:HK97 family phage prohead protease